MQVVLSRVATQGLVVLAVTMLGPGFPYSPAQVGLTLLTVGVPTLFLTSWARPTAPDPDLLGTLGRFVAPAAVITAAGGVALYAYHYTFLFAGLSRPGAPGEVLAAFERYTGLSSDDVGLVVTFSGVLFVPWFTDHFGLTEAAGPVFWTVLPALVVWFAVLSAAYRFAVLERVLGLARRPVRGPAGR